MIWRPPESPMISKIIRNPLKPPRMFKLIKIKMGSRFAFEKVNPDNKMKLYVITTVCPDIIPCLACIHMTTPNNFKRRISQILME